MSKTCLKCRTSGATKRCSVCKLAYYCSADCSAQDWNKHKNECTRPEDSILDILEQRAPAYSILALPQGANTTDELLVGPVYKDTVKTLAGAFTHHRRTLDAIVQELGQRLPGVAWCANVNFARDVGANAHSLHISPITAQGIACVPGVSAAVEAVGLRNLIPLVLRHDGGDSCALGSRTIGSALFVRGIQRRAPLADQPILPQCSRISEGLIIVIRIQEGTQFMAMAMHCKHAITAMSGYEELLSTPMPNTCHTCILVKRA